jgi:sigma-B regulation protein RsbU (phosphoserine phosphatase)
MDKKKLEHFRETISNHHEELLQWLSSKEDNDHDSQLGGADVRKVLHLVSELKSTLERIDRGRFGECKVCQGEVNLEYLEMDWTADICLEHYSELQLRQLERDLELAVKVHNQLLPCCVPALDGLETAFFNKQARFIGGDYFDFFYDKSDKQGFVVGDVMGKGMPASMLVANLQASLRILGPTYDHMGKLMEHLNRLFRYNVKLIRFISLFLLTVDIRNNHLNYANAGHHPALGLIKNSEYIVKSCDFNTGDIILLYTDGLVEARNDRAEEYGEERLEKFVRKYHTVPVQDFVNRLHDEVESFAEAITDDLTIVTVKRV